ILVSTRGDYASYIIFEPTFIIPDGVDGVEFEFQIDGTKAAVGTYVVPITFSLVPEAIAESATGNNVGVMTGATGMIEFTVSGDQVVGYTFISINAASVESDDGQFITLNISNTGNVDWRPEYAVATFTNQDDLTVITAENIPAEAFQLVPPGDGMSQQIEIAQTLPEGSYKVAMDFYDKGAVVGQLVSQPFSVFAPGTLLQSGELLSVVTKNTEFSAGEKILLEGLFKNTGDVPIKGVFMTDVYKDGEYIDLVVGEELTVGIGAEAIFSQVVEPRQGGEYTLSSYVKFAGRKSTAVDVVLTVQGGSGVLGFLNSIKGIVVLAMLIAAGAGVMVARRRNASPQAATVRRTPVPVNPVKQKVVQQPVQEAAETEGVSESDVSDEDAEADPSRRW
ncbi:MAG: hypothetical protein AAB663_01030, partial [Patescibacteria group bacterium]